MRGEEHWLSPKLPAVEERSSISMHCNNRLYTEYIPSFGSSEASYLPRLLPAFQAYCTRHLEHRVPPAPLVTLARRP